MWCTVWPTHASPSSARSRRVCLTSDVVISPAAGGSVRSGSKRKRGREQWRGLLYTPPGPGRPSHELSLFRPLAVQTISPAPRRRTEPWGRRSMEGCSASHSRRCALEQKRTLTPHPPPRRYHASCGSTETIRPDLASTVTRSTQRAQSVRSATCRSSRGRNTSPSRGVACKAATISEVIPGYGRT